jgi:hypothetical protein
MSGCLFRLLLSVLPMLCLVVVWHYVDLHKNGVYVASGIAILWFATSLLGVMWRFSLVGRFSLKSLFLATFSLNICLALILAINAPHWRFAGMMLLVLWTFVIGIAMLDSGVKARFESAEKRLATEIESEFKKENDAP